MSKKLIYPPLNGLILVLALLAGVTKHFLFPPASQAQNRPSFAQIVVAVENKCTFNKKEVTTWIDERGTEQREVKHYNDLEYDCTDNIFNGRVIQGLLKYDRARNNILSGGPVITFKGNGFTAFCRDAGAENVDWFQDNSWKGREFVVVAVYEGLQEGATSSDINVSRCEYLNP